MDGRRSSRGWGGLGAVLLCCGCAADLPPQQFETSHFRYHIRPGMFYCPGLADWMELHYATLSSYLGVALPAGRKIDSYVYTSEDDLLSNGCTGDVQQGRPTGCASGTTIHSTSVFDPHELTHAYASLLGDPPLFFQEGLAETIGCGLWGDDDWVTPPDNVASLMVTSEFRKLTGDKFFAVYGAAAGFTRFVIDRHGRDAYRAFYAQTPEDASADQVAARFAASFGEPLATAIQAWLAGPRQSHEDICMHLTECATPAIGDAGGTEQAALSCGPAVAPNTLSNPLALIRHLPITQPTAITLRASGVRPMLLRVRGCSSELRPSLGSFEVPPGGRSEVWTRLPTGDYWVLGYMPLGDDNSFSATDGAVAVDLLGPPAESACSAAPIRRISPDTVQVTLRGSFADVTERDPIDGAPDFAVSFQLDQQRLLTTDTYLHDSTPYDGSRATLCQQGCPADTPQSCMTGTLGASPMLPFAGERLMAGTPYTLVLSGTPSDIGYQFGLRFVQ